MNIGFSTYFSVLALIVSIIIVLAEDIMCKRLVELYSIGILILIVITMIVVGKILERTKNDIGFANSYAWAVPSSGGCPYLHYTEVLRYVNKNRPCTRNLVCSQAGIYIHRISAS